MTTTEKLRDDIEYVSKNSFGITPKKMKQYHITKSPDGNTVGIWQKSGGSISFYRNFNNDLVMTHNSSPKSAWQLALNVLHDKEIQNKLGIEL